MRSYQMPPIADEHAIGGGSTLALKPYETNRGVSGPTKRTKVFTLKMLKIGLN